ncbi:hypothetical protein [Pseudoalteromonas ruthenica]|uniref:pilus assembly PilX family protein n=1 Tax=Pseudoalteromonas ruthenica TaxID=151081 RepID=UPI00034DD81E|nr:hypothetical protein [Pseudoalteromonas ruthenica]
MGYLRTQQGVVLVAALIMLVAVTGIAVTLMSSSSIDVKATNAALIREEADHEVLGEQETVIADEVNQESNSEFLNSRAQMPAFGNTITLATNGDATTLMRDLNPGPMMLNCPRKFNFTEGIVCNLVEVQTAYDYGAKTRHQLNLLSGIAQEMLETNKAR